jgi:hypothetical protein
MIDGGLSAIDVEGSRLKKHVGTRMPQPGADVRQTGCALPVEIFYKFSGGKSVSSGNPSQTSRGYTRNSKRNPSGA